MIEAARAEVDRLEQLMLEGGEPAIAELRPALEMARFRLEQLEWKPPPPPQPTDVPAWLEVEWAGIRFLRRSWLSPERRVEIARKFGIENYRRTPR